MRSVAVLSLSLAVLASLAAARGPHASAQSADVEARVSAARTSLEAGDIEAARAGLEALLGDPATSRAARIESLALLIVVASRSGDVPGAEARAAELVALDPAARLPASAPADARAVLERAVRAGHSSGADVSLAWARGPGAGDCPDEAQLAARVRGRLGADPFARDPARASRRLEGWVDRSEGALVATWILRDAGGAVVGERTLRSEAPDCATLAASTVLAAALAIDPEAVLRPETAPVIEPAPPAAEPEPEPQIAAPPPEEDGLAAIVAVEGGVLAGPVPDAAPLIGARGALRIDRTFAVEGRAAWSPSLAHDGFVFGASVISLAGAIAIADGDAGRFEVAVGGLLGLTDARAVPSDTLMALDAGVSAWGGPFVGARGELALGPLRLGASVDAIVALPPREYAIAGTERVVHTAWPLAIAGTIFLGAEAP